MLVLPRAPHTIFLYGWAGVGKSYVGNWIAANAGWPVYHADDDLTDEMRDALARAHRFTDAMRDRYFAIVAARIVALQSEHEHLVVTQGAYRRRHRAFLRAQVPAMAMVCVMAPEATVLARVAARRDGISIASARALLQDFESPEDGDFILYNTGADAEIQRQLTTWFG